MALTKIKLGKYIELFSQRCNIPNLTNDQVSGVNKEKEFFEPSNQVGADTSKYKIVPPNYFACNLMHVGRDVVLPIAYNHSGKNKIVSPAYSVFRFIENDELLSDYFFIYLKSTERDRYFWFNTDGSVRDGMSWEDFIDVEIELPSIEIQRKYVEIYKGMLANQASYERGLDDLKLVCEGYIEDLKNHYIQVPISEIGWLSDERNDGEKCKNVKGLTVYKKFIDTKADMDGVSLTNYKIVEIGDIGYVPTTNRNGDKIACGLASEKCIISSTYEVLKVDKKKCYPEYLFLWFTRAEMDRFARYNSWGSAREVIEWGALGSYKIPLPPIEIQKSIADIYKVYIERKQINEQLKQQIKNLCPILIRGAVEEAARN